MKAEQKELGTTFTTQYRLVSFFISLVGGFKRRFGHPAEIPDTSYKYVCQHCEATLPFWMSKDNRTALWPSTNCNACHVSDALFKD
eukprot:scaffold2299_cov131-Cylindrotheca_fusiformis.AAC.50